MLNSKTLMQPLITRFAPLRWRNCTAWNRLLEILRVRSRTPFTTRQSWTHSNYCEPPFQSKCSSTSRPRPRPGPRAAALRCLLHAPDEAVHDNCVMHILHIWRHPSCPVSSSLGGCRKTIALRAQSRCGPSMHAGCPRAEVRAHCARVSCRCRDREGGGEQQHC